MLRYTVGTALLELPAFALAHVLAPRLGYPADGFSAPYQFMIYLGGLLFSLAGLYYLRRLLLFYYSDPVTAIVLLLLVAGTNYLNYAGIEVGMTHSWLFTLYVLILLNTHYYYNSLRLRYALRLGVLVGLVTLIRPPELISGLIPLLWGMERLSVKALRERISFWYRQKKALTLAFALAIAIISLQLFYWKYASGKWLLYTYRDQGFSWFSPYFKQYALNWQTGWLIYTPMMWLVLPGIILFWRNGRNKVALLILIVLNYYIVAAWNAWEYGGRAMIQGYPLLLFPIATFIQYLHRKKSGLLLLAPLLLFFLYFNLWWTYQAHKGDLTNSAPTNWLYFKTTVLRFHAATEVQLLRDNEETYLKAVQQPGLLYSDSAQQLSRTIVVAGDRADSVLIPLRPSGYTWLRAQATVHIPQKEWNVWKMTLFCIRLKKNGHTEKEQRIRVQRLLAEGETKALSLDIRTEGIDYDTAELFFRNENNGPLPCTISNLRLIAFNR